ncbi:hypothetical protein [Ktedonospora formicarum]|uniref:hypothetical protein n=1 Tax=Ktedonospora formicarum TaxID=2778364 RepID=UPI001C68CF05|nr:hypothetical protein [Ktedonospora formicarum]
MYQEELLAQFRQQDYEQARHQIHQYQQVLAGRTSNPWKRTSSTMAHISALLRALLTPVQGVQECGLATTTAPCCAS